MVPKHILKSATILPISRLAAVATENLELFTPCLLTKKKFQLLIPISAAHHKYFLRIKENIESFLIRSSQSTINFFLSFIADRMKRIFLYAYVLMTDPVLSMAARANLTHKHRQFSLMTVALIPGGNYSIVTNNFILVNLN